MRAIPFFEYLQWQGMLIRITMIVAPANTLLLQQTTIIMIMMLRMVIRAMRCSHFCFKSHKILQTLTSPFRLKYHFLKCVLLWCNSVSDMAALQHILSACQGCFCVNYFGDVVWIWCIIALKCATSASGPLHYMKSNRWLSTTCAICWGDLSDFRCNNCQRNEGANQKAISSDSDNITLWRCRKQRDWNEAKYQILYNNGSQMPL